MTLGGKAFEGEDGGTKVERREAIAIVEAGKKRECC